MGHIHETDSKIFGVETRSESAYLRDVSEEKNHLFLPRFDRSNVKKEIAQALMKKAGEFYGNGDSAKAAKYKELSEIVLETNISDDYAPYSFEATFEWIKEVVKFFNEHPDYIK